MDQPTIALPALLVIDMVKDNFDESRNLPITSLARKIIDPINALSAFFRKNGWPVVFATDSFHEEDFIFRGRMHPHSLEGTPGAEVVEDLVKKEEDLWLPKPKFSAFFQTDLHQWLRERGVTLCAVAGIATNYCVLTTAMDALCSDFSVVILEDCSTAATQEAHEQTLGLYRHGPLYPLFRVLDSGSLKEELAGAGTRRK